MKINKIEHTDVGCPDVLELVDKVNEIVDLLNDSFITADSGALHGSLSCDRLTPLVNETTSELAIDHLSDMIGKNIYSDISCPRCGAQYFEVGSSYCTAVYYPTIIKDGVNINPDHNKSVTTYTCCQCGHKWEG